MISSSKLKYAAGILLAVAALLPTQGASASLTSESRAALRQLVAQNPASSLFGFHRFRFLLLG